MKSEFQYKNQSLWIGLESYKESDSDIFYGRDQEIQQLSSDIFHNVQTVIYGPSGTGKTSILRAGIFKVARQYGYFPIYVRLSHGDLQCKEYHKQIIDTIESAARENNIDIEQTSQYVKLDGEKHVCASLWEYLHCNEFWTKENYPIIPLIVIDQFEEIFTLCQDRLKQATFFEQISDLSDNKLPAYIKEYINDRNNERVEYSDSANYRLVISLREDFLARLEEIAEHIPALKRNRFSLQSTNEEQALDIITKPAPGLVSEDVAIRIIECVTRKTHGKDFKLHDGEDIAVEPAILSLFCAELNKKRFERNQSVISEDLIGEFGEDILKEFYLNSIKELSADKVEFLEKGLLTDDGFRDNIALQNARNNGFTDDEITSLTDRRLIRIEEWDGTKRLEFTHDVLCKIAAAHRNECAQEKENRRLTLLEEQERTKRNIEYNKKKRATERNVLIHKGRRLIANALDFGEYRTLSYNTAAYTFFNFSRQMSRAFEDYFEGAADSEFVNQQVFSDPMLNNSICAMTFYKEDESAPTIDGIYGVELKYNGTLISDIFFKGKKVLPDGSISYDEPIYILGGYCGIHIDYDDKKREIQRTYLDEFGNPVITLDGYSVIQTKYDEIDNPVQIRYYIIKNGSLLPINHQHGNHGYDSVFDKNGNEVERYFVNEFEEPVMIRSGVYGKRIGYDSEKFCILTITNVDANGELMADKDGYVTENLIYDSNGLPTTSISLDKNGKPWRRPDGTFGSIDKIDFSKNVIETYFLNEEGDNIENNDGVYKSVLKINAKRQITEYYSIDKNDNIVESENSPGIQLWNFDELNRLQSVTLLNKDRLVISGKRYEWNKEGTHIIREFYLSENGVGINEDYGVEGIEYSVNVDDNLPVLQKFINVNKQYKTCNDGYNATRIWEDEKERVIKQLYYDIDGTPMPDENGVYGVRVEYIDENTTKRIYIDADDNITENHNGVAFTIEKVIPSGVCEIQYNINGEPYAKNGIVYIYKEKETTNYGCRERLFIHNSNKEPVVFQWPFRADSNWGQVSCMCVETNLDYKGRPLSEYFKDADGNLVGDATGDSYTIWDYDDNINLEILSLYNVEGELKLRMKTIRDSKNRIVEQSYVNKDNEYVDLERGYSGEKYEYDEEENRTIVTCIDSKGNICNNAEGYAHRIFWYDNMGRLIAQKTMKVDDTISGHIVFREFVDSEKRECAYYCHKEDGQGNIIPYENSYTYAYYEDDSQGRTIKHLYLSAEKLPVSDQVGDYGLSFEYVDEIGLTIITGLDEFSQPHNNRLGYGKIHLFKDQTGKDIKQLYFTIDGVPVSTPELLGCYGFIYEYPNDNNKIVGYLDEQGNITNNIHGYAYREECYNHKEGYAEVYYYDKERNNTQSEGDETKEFGYAVIIDKDNINKYFISLGKDGQKTNNACGYAIKHEIYEEGQLRFYKFLDVNNKPIADNFGDYGTEILYSNDDSMVRLVSLNEKYEKHINNYGYCFCDIIRSISGEQFRIYRDRYENQVLPKLRIRKRINDWLLRLKNSKKPTHIINCRQLGAIDKCVLCKMEANGYGEKLGLRSTYILLQYDKWTFGDDLVGLGELIPNSIKASKHLVLMPVTLNGSLLSGVGDIVEINFPPGQIGLRFRDWGINTNTFRMILEKKQEWENRA